MIIIWRHCYNDSPKLPKKIQTGCLIGDWFVAKNCFQLFFFWGGGGFLWCLGVPSMEGWKAWIFNPLIDESQWVGGLGSLTRDGWNTISGDGGGVGDHNIPQQMASCRHEWSSVDK